jgi:hypothetical protein
MVLFYSQVPVCFQKNTYNQHISDYNQRKREKKMVASSLERATEAYSLIL